MHPCSSDNPCEVLLVEDDARLVALFGDQLKEEADGALSLTAAATLEEAIVALTSRAFDICVLDLMLPDSAGLATLAAITEVTGGHLPIVVLTGSLDEGQRYRALALGAQAYLLKGGIDMSSILVVLRECAARHRSRLAIIKERDQWKQAASGWKQKAQAAQAELEQLRDEIRSRRITAEGERQLERAIEDIKQLAASVNA